MSRLPKRVVRLVFDRDEGRCAHCGTSEGLTIQHRINRQMGGSKTRDTAAHLLTLCWEANTRLEADSAFADLGRLMGWKLRSWQNPQEVPVRYADGTKYTLTDRFTRLIVQED